MRYGYKASAEQFAPRELLDYSRLAEELGLETIAVSNLPPRAPLKVFIEPPPVTPECGELYFCDPAPTSPAPASRA